MPEHDPDDVTFQERLRGLSDVEQRYVADGGPVRTEWKGEFAGRCGAKRAFTPDDRLGPRQHCRKAAGAGTDHPRIGRCEYHEGCDPDDGLGLWVGEIEDQAWQILNSGHTMTPGEETHGATKFEGSNRTLDQIILDLLDEQDREVYEAIHVEPVAVIDQAVKLNRVGHTRVWRYLSRRSRAIAQSGRMDPTEDPQVVSTHGMLIRFDNTLARLLEVRVRYSELAEDQSRDDFMAETLAGLSHEEFAKLAAKPWMLQKFLARPRY